MDKYLARQMKITRAFENNDISNTS